MKFLGFFFLLAGLFILVVGTAVNGIYGHLGRALYDLVIGSWLVFVGYRSSHYGYLL